MLGYANDPFLFIGQYRVRLVLFLCNALVTETMDPVGLGIFSVELAALFRSSYSDDMFCTTVPDLHWEKL